MTRNLRASARTEPVASALKFIMAVRGSSAEDRAEKLFLFDEWRVRPTAITVIVEWISDSKDDESLDTDRR